MPPEQPAVEARRLTRTYAAAGRPVRGVHEVSLEVARGEVVAVTGPSGSGKSTLLFLLAGLDRPDGGEVRVAGTDWRTLDGAARARFRRRTCGFIAQGMALLPQATAAENVEVPLLLDGVAPALRGARVAEALEGVGLAGEAAKLPDQLSGGQQQRVAIARAIVSDPAILVADEPRFPTTHPGRWAIERQYLRHDARAADALQKYARQTGRCRLLVPSQEGAQGFGGAVGLRERPEPRKGGADSCRLFGWEPGAGLGKLQRRRDAPGDRLAVPQPGKSARRLEGVAERVAVVQQRPLARRCLERRPRLHAGDQVGRAARPAFAMRNGGWALPRPGSSRSRRGRGCLRGLPWRCWW